jgi:hypothetical protein
MAYFVKIGAITKNLSGVGSRGHHIYRRGRAVFCVWGAVEVRHPRRFYWAHTTQHKTYVCNTVDAAKIKRARLIETRCSSDGYSRLPTGVRIFRQAGSRFSVLRD